MVIAAQGPALLVRLLGPVQAWRGDRELELGGPQRRAVLGLLAVRANQAVSRSELIDGIWGEDPPPSAVNALHVHVAGPAARARAEPGAPGAGPGAAGQPGRGTCCGWRRASSTRSCSPGTLAAARASRAAGDLVAAARSFDAALRLWQALPCPGFPARGPRSTGSGWASSG